MIWCFLFSKIIAFHGGEFYDFETFRDFFNQQIVLDFGYIVILSDRQGDSVFIDYGFLDTLPIFDTIAVTAGTHTVSLKIKDCQDIKNLWILNRNFSRCIFIQPKKVREIVYRNEEIEHTLKKLRREERREKIVSWVYTAISCCLLVGVAIPVFVDVSD